MHYVLYYTDNRDKGRLWYARKAPGDGGADWEYTREADQAGVFGKRGLQRWVALHGRKAGWRGAPTQTKTPAAESTDAR